MPTLNDKTLWLVELSRDVKGRFLGPRPDTRFLAVVGTNQPGVTQGPDAGAIREALPHYLRASFDRAVRYVPSFRGADLPEEPKGDCHPEVKGRYAYWELRPSRGRGPHLGVIRAYPYNRPD